MINLKIWENIIKDIPDEKKKIISYLIYVWIL